MQDSIRACAGLRSNAPRCVGALMSMSVEGGATRQHRPVVAECYRSRPKTSAAAGVVWLIRSCMP
jgi:hypothetical protein